MADVETQKTTGLIVDELADLAAGQQAMDALWARLRSWCSKPYVTRNDVNRVSVELRDVDRALAAGKRLGAMLLERNKQDGQGKQGTNPDRSGDW